jgi:hypothetical protein
LLQAVAILEVDRRVAVAILEVDRRVVVLEMNNSRVVAVLEMESRVTIPEMHNHLNCPTVSWLCKTASVLLLEFRRSCGVTSSPPMPRLMPSI